MSFGFSRSGLRPPCGMRWFGINPTANGTLFPRRTSTTSTILTGLTWVETSSNRTMARCSPLFHAGLEELVQHVHEHQERRVEPRVRVIAGLARHGADKPE